MAFAVHGMAFRVAAFSIFLIIAFVVVVILAILVVEFLHRVVITEFDGICSLRNMRPASSMLILFLFSPNVAFPNFFLISLVCGPW